MSKCEVINCNKDTTSFLCTKHARQAQDPHYLVSICYECCNISKIEFKDSKVPYKRKDQYVYIDKCENCMPWKK